MDKLLSLCMIVKNEEKTLARCLESVQGIADEIIVVDTGSNDETKAIAAQYTQHVYDFEWINDFAAAKNEAIRRATGKWVLVLDGDEYLQPGQEDAFRQFLHLYEVTEPIGIMVKIMNYHGESMHQITSVMESSAARLFPNHQGIIFERPIHEQIAVKKGSLKFLNSSFVILHTGYLNSTVAEKKKSERNMSIFQNLRSNDPYDYFTLGNEYSSSGDYKKAIYNYSKALQKSKPHLVWTPYCYEGLIIASLKLAKFQEAYDAIQVCLRLWPNHVDFHFLLGEVYYALGFNELAERQFVSCVEIAEKREREGQQAALIRLDYSQYLPSKLLVEIYIRRNDWVNAVFYLTKAIRSNSSDMKLLFQLITILARTESPDSIRSLLDKIYHISDSAVNATMLFRMSCMAGHHQLASLFLEDCLRLNVTLGPLDWMYHALLSKDQYLFERYAAELHGPVDENQQFKLFLLAALVWGNATYLKNIPSYLQLQPIVEFILNGVSYDQPDPAQIDLSTWRPVVQDLFRMGYFEELDKTLAYFKSPHLYHEFADFLYEHGQVEMAVDYYSIMIENDMLQASGYENLARLYLVLGEQEQGLQFLEQAIQLSPGSIPLYVLYCLNSDQAKKNDMKQRMLDLVPQYKKLPFIASL